MAHRNSQKRQSATLHLSQDDIRTARSISWSRRSSITMPELSPSLADLDPATKNEQRTSIFGRVSMIDLPDDDDVVARADVDCKKLNKQEIFKPWLLCSVGVFVLGVGSVVPYNKMLASDPGSPLFISFMTHVFLVICNMPKIGQFINSRRLPIAYHAVIVFFSYAFNVLRSDAFTRLPTSVGMILLNCQMLVGMAVSRIVLGTRYSVQQLTSSAFVSIGIIWAGISASSQATSAGGESTDPVNIAIGIVELFIALVSLTGLATTIKVGFNRFGECPEEQVFFQHFLALPFFYLVGSQWQQIGPRLEIWVVERDWWKASLLLANLILTFGHTISLSVLVGRVPNMLLYQMIETVKKFACVVTTVVCRSPPLPSWGFWGGSLLLVFGTLRFISVSRTPELEDVDKTQLKKRR